MLGGGGGVCWLKQQGGRISALDLSAGGGELVLFISSTICYPMLKKVILRLDWNLNKRQTNDSC